MQHDNHVKVLRYTLLHRTNFGTEHSQPPACAHMSTPFYAYSDIRGQLDQLWWNLTLLVKQPKTGAMFADQHILCMCSPTMSSRFSFYSVLSIYCATHHESNPSAIAPRWKVTHLRREFNEKGWLSHGRWGWWAVT
eukprot:5504688-Amphidinium_carterae.1